MTMTLSTNPLAPAVNTTMGYFLTTEPETAAGGHQKVHHSGHRKAHTPDPAVRGLGLRYCQPESGTMMMKKRTWIWWMIGTILVHMFYLSEEALSGCNPPSGQIPKVTKLEVSEVGASNSKSIVVGPNNDNPRYLNIQNLNPLNQTKLKLKVYGTNQEYLGWRVERLSHKGINCVDAIQKAVSPEASPNEGGFDSSGEAETTLTFLPSPDGFYIKLFCDEDNDEKQDIEAPGVPPNENYICDPDSLGSNPEVIEMTIIKVELPEGDEPGENNTLIWRSAGLPSAKFQLRPDPIAAEVNWEMAGFPDTTETKISWVPWDFIGGNIDIGYGPSPDLTVTYEDLASDYDDFMPPDNSWFGEKSVTVSVDDVFTETRAVWVYFDVTAVRDRLSDGKEIAAWYYYWKQGAVPSLVDFEYVHDLGAGVAARHNWPLFGEHTYKIAYIATGPTEKPVFDPIAHTYTQEDYPGNQSWGIHSVAKLCAHEKWHGTLSEEVRATIWSGLGHTDSDDDGLSDARELEIGTDPNDKDTCNLSSYTEGDADYSGYADYADEELFCRWKQDGHSGDETKDWAFSGMQSYSEPGD